MVKQTIVSDGGSSSYYDIQFNDEQLHMIRETNRIYYSDFIDIAFGGDLQYKGFIDNLYFAMTDGYDVPKEDTEIGAYLKLTVTQSVTALAKKKLSLDDFFHVLFGNDFDCCTILKSLKRAYEDINGRGKFGSDTEYNLNKIKYSLRKIDIKLIEKHEDISNHVWMCESILEDIRKRIK